MAEKASDSGSSAVASVAIVVLVIVALIAAYFLFFANRGVVEPDPGPDVEIEIPVIPPDGAEP